MTKLILNLKKSIEENAALYFEKAKKLKKKIGGAERALDNSNQILGELEKKDHRAGGLLPSYFRLPIGKTLSGLLNTELSPISGPDQR